MSVERHRSAGGVVVRDGEVLLITPRRGRWQLPKGRIESGETPADAAVREVREETGVEARVRAPLPSVRYTFSERGEVVIRKHVCYFLMDYLDGDTADFDPREVEGVRWLPWREALATLTFANDRRVVRRARQLALGAEG